MRIQRPCNATCGECTVYRNAFLYRESRKKVEVDSDSDDNDSDDVEDQDKQGFKDDEIMGDLEKSFIFGDCLEQERILEADGYNVKQAKEIRGYVQQQNAAGIEYHTSEVPHQDREYFIVCEYAHNLLCHIMAERNLVKFITSRLLQSTSLGLLT
jgi:hypothetical protein